LAVGANGETLVADSSTSTGLRYQAPVNANPVLNSAFQVWQRGTTFASAVNQTYSADRWWYGIAGTSNYTISRQTTGDTTNLPNIQYCARLARASGNTNTAAQYFANVFETVNSIPYAGKTITLSYYARVGANWSGTGFNGIASSGTSTDATLFSGPASNVVATSTPTLTTTWQRFTATGTVATNQTQMAVYFTWSPSGTAGANDYVEITGVQLECGSVATPFKTYAGTLQGELAACQRYYRKSYSQATAPAASGVVAGLEFAQGYAALANQSPFKSIALNPVMRTAPTITVYSYSGIAGKVTDNNGADLAVNSGLSLYVGDSNFSVSNQSGGSITPAAGGFIFHYVASAEL
jgi:hypothetical protein